MSTNRNNQIGPPRFAVTVHVLVRLAKSECFLSSAAMACGVNTHATFLRRVLAMLASAGIVEAKEGRDGGYSLKTPADQLTLGDIYLAVRGEGYGGESTECPEESDDCQEKGKRLDDVLEGIMTEAEQKSVEFLRQYTLEEVIKKID